MRRHAPQPEIVLREEAQVEADEHQDEAEHAQPLVSFRPVNFGYQ